MKVNKNVMGWVALAMFVAALTYVDSVDGLEHISATIIPIG